MMNEKAVEKARKRENDCNNGRAKQKGLKALSSMLRNLDPQKK